MFARTCLRFATASLIAVTLTACYSGDDCVAALDMTCGGTGWTHVMPPAKDDGLSFARAGAHPVGFQTFSVEREGADAMMVKVWYPATPGVDVVPVEYPVDLKHPDWHAHTDDPTVRGRAALGAPVAGGRHPAVIFSHGYALNPEWYAELIEHFASRGYVVFAAEHVEHDWLAAFDAALRRPVDVHATLDFVEDLTAADGAWPEVIDLDRVALVGHSFGGYTALAAAGARIDTRAIDAHCGDLDAEDPRSFLCAPFVGSTEEAADRVGMDSPPEALWPSMKDDRIAAIVPISADAWLFGAEGLASVDVPTMAIGGTEDFGAPWAWSNAPIFAHVGGDLRASVGLEGGGHFLAANLCSDLPWLEAITDIYAFACFDAAWDRREGLDIVKHYAAAFLATVLDDDLAARRALEAPAPTNVRLAVGAGAR